jgi:hypothetical protein
VHTPSTGQEDLKDIRANVRVLARGVDGAEHVEPERRIEHRLFEAHDRDLENVARDDLDELAERDDDDERRQNDACEPLHTSSSSDRAAFKANPTICCTHQS